MNGSRLNDFLTLSREHPWALAPFRESLPDGSDIQVWDTGVLCIEPAAPGNTDIVISCGIHGNETAPIELCERILRAIVAGELACRQRLLLIFGNPAAMNLGVREVEENLNRLFSGAHARGGRHSRERERAARLEQYVRRFFEGGAGAERLHYDLHTAIRPSRYEKFAIYPFTHGAPYRRRQLALLSAGGVDTILLAHGPTTTFSYFSAHQFGAHAFTVELGKVMPFGQNDSRRFAAMEQSLMQLIGRPDWQPAPFDPERVRLFRVCREVTKHSGQFGFTFADDVANFTAFPHGTLLARDGEREWRVEHEQEAVVFPNAKVAAGHRAALLVIRTDATDLLLD
ncbi:succinylglutamate desuccinylase [Zobellella endophytica]|uniref:Succinylglutamate desuccinylase n=1 Tax=Zobellella endophytica TaxID=2116700 RepID=A0A2P7RD28_9GAMM|nr:succinylglutamate desuccinylase [Zobellella endophytica]PSJ48123.1 succinylglutamate desuccinylase [Zobellella endophytica]